MDIDQTGVAAIDAMRREMASSPITPDNAVRRQSLIMAWVRLLVHEKETRSDPKDVNESTSSCRESVFLECGGRVWAYRGGPAGGGGGVAWKSVPRSSSPGRQVARIQQFSLKEDIGETSNLISSMPEKDIEMERLLMNYLQPVKAELPVPNPTYSGPNPYLPMDPVN